MQTALGTPAIHTAEFNVRQVNRKIAAMFGGKSPFTAHASAFAKVTDLRSRKYEWNYQKYWPTHVEVGEIVSAGSTTTIVLTSTNGLSKDRILVDEVTGEQIVIMTVDSSTSLTVVRSYGIKSGQTATGFSVGKKLKIGSVARKEGHATAVEAASVQPTNEYNLAQQFEGSWSLTDIAAQIDTYYGDPEAYQERFGMEWYMDQKEEAGLFQQRYDQAVGTTDASAGGKFGQRIMGGAYYYIENYNSGANILDAGGAFTEQELSSFMHDRSRPCSTRKFNIYTSGHTQEIMTGWKRPYHQSDMMDKDSFGFSFSKIKGNGWEADVYESEAFNTSTRYNQMAIINKSAEYSRWHTMVGLSDNVNREITGPKKDGSHITQHQITGVHTLEVVPFAHMWAINIES